MEPDMLHGWVELPSGAMMHVHEGIPDKVAVYKESSHDALSIAQEVTDYCGLHVRVVGFRSGTLPEEDESPVEIDPEDLFEVLRRLANCSAQVFFDRYHKVLDEFDVDFEDEAFARDFQTAMMCCGRSWEAVDVPACRNLYHDALTTANREIAQTWVH